MLQGYVMSRAPRRSFGLQQDKDPDMLMSPNGQAYRVMIVEDDIELARLTAEYLEKRGIQVTVEHRGDDALARIQREQPHLVVLDVMLPGTDGFDICRELRASGSDVPIVMLTARDEDIDQVLGLEMGADDYLAKPFELAILRARLHGLLRRSAWAKRERPQAPSAELYTFAGKTIDFTSLELKAGDKTVRLTLMEADLLRYLIQHEGQPVARKAILDEVWELHEDTDTRAIDNFIVRLRKYIEDDPAHPQHLLTVRGVGYRFVANS